MSVLGRVDSHLENACRIHDLNRIRMSALRAHQRSVGPCLNVATSVGPFQFHSYPPGRYWFKGVMPPSLVIILLSEKSEPFFFPGRHTVTLHYFRDGSGPGFGPFVHLAVKITVEGNLYGAESDHFVEIKFQPMWPSLGRIGDPDIGATIRSRNAAEDVLRLERTGK